MLDAKGSSSAAASALAAPAAPGAGAPHVIVVGNEKGGAGKSTIAMHLVAALLAMGRRVAVLDLDDRQRTLSRYLENRAAARGARALPMPDVLDAPASRARDLDVAEAEERARFARALSEAGLRHFVVIDAPGRDSHLSRLAHAAADTLVTPLNDSFVDFDLLGEVDAARYEVRRPSCYAELVWESRKAKAAATRRPIDWVVARNRLAPSAIAAKNQQRVAEALKALSARVGYRIAPGLSERVIYRELFPAGLTLLDLQAVAGRAMSTSEVAARQEVRDLFIALQLPGLEGERLTF